MSFNKQQKLPMNCVMSAKFNLLIRQDVFGGIVVDKTGIQAGEAVDAEAINISERYLLELNNLKVLRLNEFYEGYEE